MLLILVCILITLIPSYLFIRVYLVGDFREELLGAVMEVNRRQWRCLGILEQHNYDKYEIDFTTLNRAFGRKSFDRMLFSIKPLKTKYWFTKEESDLFNEYLKTNETYKTII